MPELDDRFIDVQSHFLPPVYMEAVRAAGMTQMDGWEIPKWDVPGAIANMDQLGVAAQILSVSSPGITFVERQGRRALARALNEFAAETIRDHSPRFGAFATLPLPDVDDALAELTYALDTLKLDGVGLFSNYNGSYLGAAMFDPIFDELNRREAVVFVHPTAPPNFDPVSVGLTPPILEFPFETTRMAANLLGSGTIERCPDIQLILPHGGGTLPFLQVRLAHPFGAERAALLSTFYYDLTAASTPGQLAALATLVPPTKLLMGVDYPFMPNPINVRLLAGLEKANFTAEERGAMRSGNALKLFPQVAARLAASTWA